MRLGERLGRYAARRASRKATRAVPLVGTVVAVAFAVEAMRRKGFFRGLVHTGLDMMPVVGTAKNLVEAWRGEDLLPDRPPARPA